MRLTAGSTAAPERTAAPRAAFTMIELLVVIAIIAILAALFHWRFRPWIPTTTP